MSGEVNNVTTKDNASVFTGGSPKSANGELGNARRGGDCRVFNREMLVQMHAQNAVDDDEEAPVRQKRKLNKILNVILEIIIK